MIRLYLAMGLLVLGLHPLGCALLPQDDPRAALQQAAEAQEIRKQRLRAELDRWMISQGDPGVPQDTQEAIQAARRGEHLYGPTKP